MDKKLIVANWKMNPESLARAQALFTGVKVVAQKLKNVDVVICAPSVYVFPLKKLESSKIILGTQNVSSEIDGAFTGQISAGMQKSVGVNYTIVGHSECRSLGETDEMIAKKVSLLLKNNITPILCVGESERDNSSSYLAFVKHQLLASLAGIPKASIKKIVIAYEPVWALSSTVNRHDATPADSHEMALYIRKMLADMTDPKTAHSIKILYGGSVNKNNAKNFLLNGGVNGMLVGKASLSVKDFGKIIMDGNNTNVAIK